VLVSRARPLPHEHEHEARARSEERVAAFIVKGDPKMMMNIPP